MKPGTAKTSKATALVEAALQTAEELRLSNLRPALPRYRPTPIRRYAYAEKFGPNGPGQYDRYHRSIRDERWKLVRIFRADRIPATQEEFHDLESAAPGVDGDDLCPCPENLEGEARAAYERLAQALDEVQGS